MLYNPIISQVWYKIFYNILLSCMDFHKMITSKGLLIDKTKSWFSGSFTYVLSRILLGYLKELVNKSFSNLVLLDPYCIYSVHFSEVLLFCNSQQCSCNIATFATKYENFAIYAGLSLILLFHRYWRVTRNWAWHQNSPGNHCILFLII